MGNILIQNCTTKKQRKLNNLFSFESTVLSGQFDLLIYNNPILAALHMVNFPAEEASIGLRIFQSSSLTAVENSGEIESAFTFILKYLQLSLPLDCPLSGSITSLILREVRLPSRILLKKVSEILELVSLSRNLENLIIFFQQSLIQNTSRKIDSSNNKSTFGYFHSFREINCTEFRDKQILLKAHNACVIIAGLATQFRCSNADFLLNNDLIRFLVVCCRLSKINVYEIYGHRIWTIVLQAIICFEKFALTRNCKNKICKYFNGNGFQIPFKNLESFSKSNDMLKREVGFLSQWLLDNLYISPFRSYTYLNIERTNLNAVMHIREGLSNIKLSPNGLEVRSDSDSSENVRCTFKVVEGTFYYEAKLVTSGIMQIGWVSQRSRYMSGDGHDNGDGMFSLAYDGFRKIIWYNGVPYKETHLSTWKPGDILGCLINLTEKFAVFSINGKSIKKQKKIFLQSNNGFYAAASFLNNQQCLFNFGREPFKYPPHCRFSTFNDKGSLLLKDKIILPRSLQLSDMTEYLEEIEDPCEICFTVSAEVCLQPCNHKGFCKTCISKVKSCPLCRSPIVAIRSDPIYYTGVEGESRNFQSTKLGMTR